jgi:cell division protein FtsB
MGAAAFVLMLMTVFGEQGIFKVRQLRQDRGVLEAKISEAERETAELRRRIQTLRSGPAPYERAAREQLGLVKPGEIVYDFRTNPLR